MNSAVSNGSCLGFQETGGGYRYPFFCYAPQILVMRPFFCNVPLKYCNALAHYKKTGALQKTGGRITKKWAHNKKTGTCSLHLFPEIRNKNHC